MLSSITHLSHGAVKGPCYQVRMENRLRSATFFLPGGWSFEVLAKHDSANVAFHLTR
jgi:hypothetical protein